MRYTIEVMRMLIPLCIGMMIVVYGEQQYELYKKSSAEKLLKQDEAGKILNSVPNPELNTKKVQPVPKKPTGDNETESDESDMDSEGEWVQHAPPEEIEEAKHLLDSVHVDFQLTYQPLAFIGLIMFVTLAKPTLHWPILRWFPESVVLMMYGVISASFVRFVLRIDPGPLDSYMFFMILLPAIVIDAGLSMQKKEFFQALPKILMLAVFGTVFHAILLAVTLYAAETYFDFTPGFLHLFVFATLISAVDPVSVLSTFAELDVKKSLFTLIFGESLCNDAVTIVLYRTAINVIKNSDASDANLTVYGVVFQCTVQFLLVCFGGIGIGFLGGVLGVYTMKIMVGHQMNQPVYQLCFPYLVYLLAETFHYSGILAAISCAGFMSLYMPANMCVEMEFAAFTFSKTASSLSESCIFFYLGVSVVSNKHEVSIPFICLTVVCCTLYRLIVVCALSSIYNLFASIKNKIPFADQLVVTHAGIRGAVCFGLVQIIDERIVPAKPYFVTTTLVMIIVTSLCQGCTIKYVMAALKIPGDDGKKQEDTAAFTYISKINNKYLKKWLTSDNTYLPTDETFRNLGLPKAVSTALRIGERSQTDLTRHGEVSTHPTPTVSVGRPTVSPFNVDFNLEEDTRPLSTGRRTPVARNASRYSRHFIYTAAAHDVDNYLTCPVSGPKRPTFDPNQLYNNQMTISNPGDADRARSINRRHNSMGAESIELKHMIKGVPEKKLSRTVTSGNKKFFVNPDDLIREESPSTAPRVAVFELDETKTDDSSESK